MTVEYLRAVQTTEVGMRFDNGEWFSTDIWRDFAQHYHTGYSECVREVLKYMGDVEGVGVTDTRCARMLSFLHNRFRSEVTAAENGNRVSPVSGTGSPSLGSIGSNRASFLAAGCASGMVSSAASSRDLTVLNSVKTLPSTLGGSSAFDTRLMAPPHYLSPSVSSGSSGDVVRSPLHPSSSLPSLNVVPSPPFLPLPALSIPAVDYLRFPPTANFMCSRSNSILGAGMTTGKDALSSGLQPGLGLPMAPVRKDECSSV
ncbi:hairy and enhancer of split-related protein HELT-like [Littorina saxatilis]